MQDLGPLKPVELSADDFIRELAAAQNWGLMDFDATGRQLLMVVTEGMPDQAFLGPDPQTMENYDYWAFLDAVEDAMAARAAYDTPRE